MMASERRPKRILAIDGGGVRGVVAIAFLEALERKLTRESGAPVALRDHFDLIGGTSTGAIVATALALGVPLENVRETYFDMAPVVFKRTIRRIKFLQAQFLGEELERHVARFTGDSTLETPQLKPGGLAIITKRFDTGSVWFLTNNPEAPYWKDGEHVGNRHYRLSSLIRASAAAPLYFAPQRINVVDGQPPGLFIDGSVSPHNNPALALLQIATVPAYGYGWKTGADRLEITSIGTGTYHAPPGNSLLLRIAAGFAIKSLQSMMADCDEQVLTIMQALGNNRTPWKINNEIGDLTNVCIAPAPLFTFHRYNLLLDNDWLERRINDVPCKNELKRYSKMDNVETMRPLYRLAKRVAARELGV